MFHKPRILSVTVKRVQDESPDLSWIGEYGNSPKSPAAIDREERGERGHGEYRYFNPQLTGEETGNPQSPEQDYERMEAYSRGEWCMLGIIAEAEVQFTATTVQTISSGGLWGIESDGGADYFTEVEEEQLSALADELAAMGIGKRAIAYAVKNAKRP